MIGCIQYRNTSDGRVHVFEMEKEGAIIRLPEATAILTSDSPNFTYDFKPEYSGDHEFCAIKTRNTGNDRVEMHILSRSSGYRSFKLQAKTAFEVSDAPNFDFLVGKANGDLIGVKRRNTESGRVEVHVASRVSGYSKFSLHAATPIPITRGDHFVFGAHGLVVDAVVAIKIAFAESGFIEVHGLKNNAEEWAFHLPSGILLSSVPGRTWLYEQFNAPTSVVVGVTNGPTDSGFVEIMRGPVPDAPSFPPPPSNHRSALDTSRIGDFVFKMIGIRVTPPGGGF